MTAFENGRMVAETLASGVADFALTGFTPAAFNLAGKGMIKAIASRTREKRYYEGTELVVSNTGFSKACRNSRISSAGQWRSTPSAQSRTISLSRSRGSRKLTSTASR
jgi:hypothetical protein